MALGVQLAEQHQRRLSVDGDAQRRRTGRASQPERLDVSDDQAELILQAATDRRTTGTADVEVGAATASVRDRERLVGSEQAEGEQHDGHPHHRAHHHVGRSVRSLRHPRHTDATDQHRRRPFADVATAARRHQRIQHSDQRRRQDTHLYRWHRPATPARLDVHPERSWSMNDRSDRDGVDHHDQLGSDHQHNEMAEAAKHQQGHDQPRPQHRDRHPRPDLGETLEHRRQARYLQLGQPPHDRVVDDRHRHGRAAHSPSEDDDRQGHEHHRSDQPTQSGGLHVMRQRWRPTGRATAARRSDDPQPGGLQLRCSRARRFVCEDTHRSPLNRSRPQRHQQEHPTRVRASTFLTVQCS